MTNKNKSTLDEYEQVLNNAKRCRKENILLAMYYEQRTKELRCIIAMKDW